MTLFYLALLVLSGFGMARVLGRFGLPEVTGYLLVGLALGPSWLHVVGHEAVVGFEPLATFCLATIFFLLGEEFDLALLRRAGPRLLAITAVQSLVTSTLVTGLLLAMRAPLPVALLLGAIAATSDPAATLAVVRETGARGELAKTLLAIVALNGFVEMGLLSVLLPVVGLLHPGAASAGAIIADSLRELVCSVGLGVALGLGLRVWSRRCPDALQLPALGAILLGAGAASVGHLSMLLVMLAFGAAVANLVPRREAVFDVARAVQGPLLVVFFTLAGARLNLGELFAVGGLGLVYVLGRLSGKLLGGALGATLAGAAPICRRYLGCGLVPQAGMAIGLAVMLQERFPDLMGPLVPIVLGAVVVFEAVGPLLTRVALWRARVTTSGHPVVKPAAAPRDAAPARPLAPAPAAVELAQPVFRTGWYDPLPGRYAVPVWRAHPPQT